MFGAIIGDIVGSPYEFDMGDKTKDFPLFSKHSHFTDDTIMTLAVADAFMTEKEDADDEVLCRGLVNAMQKWGKKYPFAGYGASFLSWLSSTDPKPYNSYGNGSAMRVSSVAWIYDDLSLVRRAARLSALVTHNHPEGIKGAESVACAIFLARTGSSKGYIKEFIQQEFGYDLSRSCDEIRPSYSHVESCMETVPEAMTAFLESTGFEDAIRNAVSLGGDCDTLTAITGSIAEGFYGLDDSWRKEVYRRLDPALSDVLARFDRKYRNGHPN